MNEIRELLQEARHHIDGGCDCRTPEYRALDLLERAVTALADKVRDAQTRTTDWRK